MRFRIFQSLMALMLVSTVAHADQQRNPNINGKSYNDPGFAPGAGPSSIEADDVVFCEDKRGKIYSCQNKSDKGNGFCSYVPANPGKGKKPKPTKGAWVRKGSGVCTAIYIETRKGPRCQVTLYSCPFLEKGKAATARNGILKAFVMNGLAAVNEIDPTDEETFNSDFQKILNGDPANSVPPHPEVLYDTAIPLVTFIPKQGSTNKPLKDASFLDPACAQACAKDAGSCSDCCTAQDDYWKNFCTYVPFKISKYTPDAANSDGGSVTLPGITTPIKLPHPNTTFTVKAASKALGPKEMSKGTGKNKTKSPGTQAACLSCD